jgi:hypothetical protein
MALECNFTALAQLDTTDIDAVRGMLDGCLDVLLDPVLWLWVIVITVVCVAGGALIGWIKGRTLAGLVWGAALGPIGWIVVALSKSKLPECPECGKPNRCDAKVCRHCGLDFRKFAQRTARSGFKGNNGSGGW